MDYDRARARYEQDTADLSENACCPVRARFSGLTLRILKFDLTRC